MVLTDKRADGLNRDYINNEKKKTLPSIDPIRKHMYITIITKTFNFIKGHSHNP